MLIILRILITGALIYVFGQMRDQGAGMTVAGDLSQAFYMGIVLILSILMAAVWAPYLGERIADPITGEFTSGSFTGHARNLPRLIRWFESHRWRRLTLFCCILEGLDNPDFPMPFTTGLRHTRRGSWWEKVFALEVFRFDNAQNCLEAADILRDRHDIIVDEHDRPSITVALKKRERVQEPPREPVALPKAPPPPKPKRNKRIRIFLDDSEKPAKESSTKPNQNQKSLESPSALR